MSSADFADFAERYLDIRDRTGHEWMCICLFHEDSNASMQFNVEKGLFVCFACGTGGSYRKIERRLGVDHREIGVSLDVVYRRINDLRKLARQDEGPRILPESTLAAYRAIPHDGWAQRGLKPQTIEAFDLGYDIGTDAMTIPVRTINGELLGVIRRYCDPDADPRYRYPKGFHKSEHLFGSWLVANDHRPGPVALTEGSIDAMTLWQYGIPAMGILGSYVSESHIRILKRLGLTQLLLFFDNDKAGAQIVERCKGWKHTGNDQWRRDEALDLRRFFQVKTVNWRGVPRRVAKDPNDLNLIRARNMAAAAVPL